MSSPLSFRLRPFDGSAEVGSLEITGRMGRRRDVLTISYELSGPLEKIAVPVPAAVPARMDGLWQETCFELFLALQGSPRYWEFNCSPAGHWSAYRFSGYRQGMQVETAFSSLPFTVSGSRSSLALAMEVELGPIIRADQALDVAITAVLKHAEGERSYWALAHCGLQPDFHQRESFVLQLDPGSILPYSRHL